jgi:hypothetical protein
MENESKIEKWTVIHFANKKSIFANNLKDVARKWLNFTGVFAPGEERRVLECSK